jgi:S1-C subfamily serine protease
LRKGDRIEAVQGFPIASAEEFRFRVRELGPGASARIEAVRGGKPVQFQISAVELSGGRIDQLVKGRVGISLTEEKVREGKLVVVKSVDRGSPAARVGLQAGDLIREVNSTELEGLAEFRRLAGQARRSGRLVLLVQRGFAAERIAFDFD